MIPLAVLACSVVLQQTAYDTVYDQVKNLAPTGEAAPVRGLVVRRDIMTLKLDSGTAFLLTPVGDRTVGIAFVGWGTFSFEPPLIVEQYNLKHVLGDSTVNGPITAATLIFTDSTAAELRRQLKFTGGTTTGSGDAAEAAHAAIDYLVDGRSHTGDWSLFSALLNRTTTEYFSAYVKRQHGESVLMKFDPGEAEEVLLLRRGKMAQQRTEIVCQFERADDLIRNINITDKDPDNVAVNHYDIDANIDGNYKFAAKTDIRLLMQRNRQQWVPFYLYSELAVDSVRSAAGEALRFFRKDHQPELWIRLPKPANAGDTVNVRVVYHGNLIGFGSAIEDFLPPWWDPARRQEVPFLDAWAFIKDPSGWYPRFGPVQRASFALTFHTPAKFKFASTGRLVDSSTSGDVWTSHWETELPARNVSFNIGTFEQLDIRDPRIPPVTVEVNAEAHRTIGRVFLSARNPETFVGADVANSLAFFTRMFGPPLFHQYYATEIPYYHGEAFPGLIHLSWVTFLGLNTDGRDEIFRAHEMAHQWWGIGVEPATYRDAWLSEGFSDFAGMWYMQMILRDNDKYLKVLHDSRQTIRRERNNAAPIGLGRRAGESWRGNYELSTYEKGAWVVHMLRNMLLDQQNMSEDRFIAVMQDFYKTYRGKRATTEDFQRVVERHVGQPMDWFFNEWVYGNEIPTYTFSWSAAKDSAGFAAQLRVRQSDVSAGFAMFVPVLIKFEQGEALVRLLVRGPVTDVTLRLPSEPKSMQLNPLESVLAEVKTEDWHE